MSKKWKIGAVALLFSGVAVAQTIEQRVVDEEITQYRIVVENGSTTEICVHAGMVKAAMLQAHDSSGYYDWGQVESRMCSNHSSDTLRDQARSLAASSVCADALYGGTSDGYIRCKRSKADKIEAKEEEVYNSLFDTAMQYVTGVPMRSKPTSAAAFGKYCIDVQTGARVLCSN